MADSTPFYRMGEPRIFTATPTSGNNAVPLTIPRGATSFRVVNNNPFAIRLKGWKEGVTPNGVTATTGWLFLPGTTEIYATLSPANICVMSVDGPFAASDPAQKAGTGVIELQYGTGA